MRKIELNPNLSSLAKMSKGDLLQKIGVEDFRKVLVNVFQGENIRSFTEILTRNRLMKCNRELWSLFIVNKKNGMGPLDMIPIVKGMLLEHRGLSSKDKAVCEWLVGITDKQNQNVLRKNHGEEFDLLTEETIDVLKHLFDGVNKIPFKANNGVVQFTAEEMIWISMVIGSMTLTVRGSEKSLHGKYFEKLVLGSLFQMYGLEMVDVGNVTKDGFWLSSQQEKKRESDATIVSRRGEGIRVDIGFIGSGNSEVTLDKVSRYLRQDEISGKKYNMSTLIIVDSLGENSRAKDMALDIEGEIVCMSDPDWVIQVFDYISRKLGMSNPINTSSLVDLDLFLEREIKKVDMGELIN